MGERDRQPPARNRAAIFCPYEKLRFTEALKNLTPSASKAAFIFDEDYRFGCAFLRGF